MGFIYIYKPTKIIEKSNKGGQHPSARITIRLFGRLGGSTVESFKFLHYAKEMVKCETLEIYRILLLVCYWFVERYVVFCVFFNVMIFCRSHNSFCHVVSNVVFVCFCLRLKCVFCSQDLQRDEVNQITIQMTDSLGQLEKGKGDKKQKWRFPEIGVPPNHPFVDIYIDIDVVFDCKPSSYGGTPIYGTVDMSENGGYST